MTTLSQILTGVALACTLALGGCGDSGTPSAGQASNGKKIIIGVVAKSQSNPVFQAAHAGARDAAKELGPKYGVDVEVNIQTPPQENPQAQAEAIGNLTRAGAKGIMVSCSEAGALTDAINDAVDKGVVVVTFDSDAPASKRLCCYGTDDADCGKRVMDELAPEMNKKGIIAILAGNQSAPNLQNRVKGVRDELKNFPDIKEISSGAVYHEETPEKAAERIQQVQRANPEITGWAMIGGWPLFTQGALPWDPGTVKVVSVDALPAQLSYLETGHVQVLLAQDCYGWGTKSMEILLDKIVKNKDPKSTKIVDPLTRVTKENAKEWAKKWDKWLGK